MAALSGLKVLDFTALLPGPFASLYLADLGAEVLRIEAVDRVDLVRLLPPAAHAWLHRGKRSIALNLKQAEAQAVVRDLVAGHDVLLEGFRPGVMARLGLDQASLRAINPRLIYASLTGFGQTGARAGRAGHDIGYLALSGLLSYGAEGRPPLLGAQLGDLAGGSQPAVIAILAALVERERTGLGQHLDISIRDNLLALNALAGAVSVSGGPVPRPADGILNGGSVYGFYETADQRYLALGALEPKFWQVLCTELGHPEWSGRGIGVDLQEQQELRRMLAEIFAGRTLAQWQSLFTGIDACIEPVLDVGEAYALAEAEGREVVWRGGSVPQPASPLVPEHGEILPAPVPGQHTGSVLAELGYASERIAALLATGAAVQG